MKRNNQNTKKVFIYIGCFLVICIVIAHYIGYKAFYGNATTTGGPSPQYVNLFNEDAKTDLTWGTTYNTFGRNPISEVVYGLKYKTFSPLIDIYKINLLKDLSLLKLINVEHTQSFNKNDKMYQSIVSKFETFQNRKNSLPPAQNIYLNFDADSIQTVTQNDSVFECYSNFNAFSISYIDGEQPDIFIKNKMLAFHPWGIWTSFLFIKKQTALYFLVMQNPNYDPATYKTLLSSLMNYSVNWSPNQSSPLQQNLNKPILDK